MYIYQSHGDRVGTVIRLGLGRNTIIYIDI